MKVEAVQLWAEADTEADAAQDVENFWTSYCSYKLLGTQEAQWGV